MVAALVLGCGGPTATGSPVPTEATVSFADALLDSMDQISTSAGELGAVQTAADMAPELENIKNATGAARAWLATNQVPDCFTPLGSPWRRLLEHAEALMRSLPAAGEAAQEAGRLRAGDLVVEVQLLGIQWDALSCPPASNPVP